MLSRRSFLKHVSALPLTAMLPSRILANASEPMFELRAAATGYTVGRNSNPLSPLWLYNGRSPGPELRVRRGERIRVRFINDLSEPSSIHWHGIRIANSMDGVPGLTQDAVQPGGFFDYDFVAPDAGTYWYHAHDHSWAQVGRGLYGPLIVEEPTPLSGLNDLTLVLDDWRLDQSGRLLTDFDSYMREKHFGRIGETVTVNSMPIGSMRTLTVGRFHRIRLINASNARVFRLRLRDIEAHVVALDGQNIKRPKTIDSLSLAPGQRIDLLVRLRAGDLGVIEDAEGTIDSAAGDKNPARLIALRGEGLPPSNETEFPILPPSAMVEENLEAARHIPLLMEGGSLSNIGGAQYRGKQLNAQQLATAQQVWKFNGIANLPRDPLFRVERGQTVLVEIKNSTGFAHAMHVHGHHFRVLKSDGNLGNWRDTTLMDAQSKQTIAFVADNPGKWLFHCHMLEHAAAGMRTWFDVV